MTVEQTRRYRQKRRVSIVMVKQKEQHHTAFAGPRKGDRVATDATERVEDDVAATSFRYLSRYCLGRHAVPPLLVQ